MLTDSEKELARSVLELQKEPKKLEESFSHYNDGLRCLRHDPDVGPKLERFAELSLECSQLSYELGQDFGIIPKELDPEHDPKQMEIPGAERPKRGRKAKEAVAQE